jgi:nucleoside-diphosphate-sugar epimerase
MLCLRKERNMNSIKDKAGILTDATYVILGATGNTGSIIADFLLSKGKKVRVVGRDAGRLQRFVRKGAEAFTGDVSDAAALTKAFSGARAAYLMLPPITSREDQERGSDAFAKAVKESGLRFAVHLSSYGAHVPEGTGPLPSWRQTQPDGSRERASPWTAGRSFKKLALCLRVRGEER